MKPAYLLLVYRDRAGEWRLRLSHRNGKITFDGGQGYSRRGDAVRAAKRLKIAVAQAVVHAQKA